MAGRYGDPLGKRKWQDEAVVVVRVLTDQIDPSGRGPDTGGIAAMLLRKSLGNEIDVLGAHMRDSSDDCGERVGGGALTLSEPCTCLR